MRETLEDAVAYLFLLGILLFVVWGSVYTALYLVDKFLTRHMVEQQVNPYAVQRTPERLGAFDQD